MTGFVHAMFLASAMVVQCIGSQLKGHDHKVPTYGALSVLLEFQIAGLAPVSQMPKGLESSIILAKRRYPCMDYSKNVQDLQ